MERRFLIIETKESISLYGIPMIFSEDSTTLPNAGVFVNSLKKPLSPWQAMVYTQLTKEVPF